MIHGHLRRLLRAAHACGFLHHTVSRRVSIPGTLETGVTNLPCHDAGLEVHDRLKGYSCIHKETSICGAWRPDLRF